MSREPVRFSLPHAPDAVTVNGGELAVELSLMVWGSGGPCRVWKLKISVEGVQRRAVRHVQRGSVTVKCRGRIRSGPNRVADVDEARVNARIETLRAYGDGQSLRRGSARRARRPAHQQPRLVRCRLGQFR